MPLLLASWIMLERQIGFSISLTYIKDLGKGFLFRTICDAYDLYYQMFGLFLVAPFLQKMLDGLSEREKRWFLGVLTGYIAFFSLGIWFSFRVVFTGYPFLNWITFALCGCLIRRISWKRWERRLLLGAGVLAFLVSTTEMLWFAGKNWAIDSFCLTRLFLCMAIFMGLFGNGAGYACEVVEESEAKEIVHETDTAGSVRRKQMKGKILLYSAYIACLLLPFLIENADLFVR